MQLQTSEPLYQIMLARYYGESVPRFLSADPIGGRAPRPQSWNRYAYVLGNPMKLVDPSGMMSAIPDTGPGIGNPFVPGGPGGWWQGGPGGATGWGNVPCVMCAVGDNPPFPPDYDPKTWKSDKWDGDGKDFLRDPNGDVWTAHPEDEGHWRHWDKQDANGKEKGSWPEKSDKPWPGQKKRSYGNQSATDPSGNAPGYKLMSVDPLLFAMPFPSLVGLGFGLPAFQPGLVPIFGF